MTNQEDGWSRLACPYFRGSVREIVDPAAKSAGYELSSQRKEHEIAYLGPDGVVIRLAYLPETSPNYELRCVIELSKSESTNDVDFFPVWFLEKRGVITSRLPHEFSSEDQLREALNSLSQIMFGTSGGIGLYAKAQLVNWLEDFSAYWASKKNL